MTHPLLELVQHGQSPWLDDLGRHLLDGGRLRSLIERDGVRGVTSNPAIFQKALAGSDAYDAQLRELVEDEWLDAGALYEALAVRDIQQAADLLRPIYDASDRRDGFVSLEVSPHLARDAEGTIAEARRLWRTVDRPNLMIKVPGTPEGVPAIESLVADGISVNVTLLFAVDAYVAAARAWMSGLERWLERGGDPGAVASVASFFVSRIDGQIDGVVKQPELRGRAAIANAVLAYARFRELLAGARWQALADRGAHPQRVLWASTGTKNPDYSSTLYVDELVAADTVTTLPEPTLEAFRSGGRSEPRLGDAAVAWEKTLAEAQATIAALDRDGVSLNEVTDRLLVQGVELFADAFDALLSEVERRRRTLLGQRVARQSGDDVEGDLLDEWRREHRGRRMWQRDASLWTGSDESRWLDWLDAPARARRDDDGLAAVCRQALRDECQTVLLLGMGGSSLCPDVLAHTFGRQAGWPELRVLDSSVPEEVLRVCAGLDLARTLVVVASKSGSTIEPNAAMRHLHARLAEQIGERAAWERFAAITDPGSSLERHARDSGFRAIALGQPGIGGRFSALSPFGLLPARLMGLDVEALLDAGAPVFSACQAAVPPTENPGIRLGLAIAQAAQRGRDKLSFLISPGLASLGGWLEQLIAESTGKGGQGIIPIDGEQPGAPDAYGPDRLFVRIALGEDAGDADAELDRAADELSASGQPVIRIDVPTRAHLLGELFRWEIATAVAGAALHLNPFDQPDVEAAKQAARALMEAGGGGEAPPWLTDGGLQLRADDTLEQSAARDLEAALAEHLARLREGDYFAINAFLAMSPEIARELQALRHTVRDGWRVATSMGFGPRYLHSTGQLHKGGPGSGLFLVLTARGPDLEIPGQETGFRALSRAQAEGDFRVLCERGRRALWLDLGEDVGGGLRRLVEATRKLCAP